MQSQDYKLSVRVNATPEKAFEAINNVRGWWSEEIAGDTQHLNDEFFHHFKDVHSCRIKLIEMVPNKKVVWKVLENHFNFTKDKTEWIGTKIVFEISSIGSQSQIDFTHEGLVPENECYEICATCWNDYLQNSLTNLIHLGKGNPNLVEA